MRHDKFVLQKYAVNNFSSNFSCPKRATIGIITNCYRIKNTQENNAQKYCMHIARIQWKWKIMKRSQISIITVVSTVSETHLLAPIRPVDKFQENIYTRIRKTMILVCNPVTFLLKQNSRIQTDTCGAMKNGLRPWKANSVKKNNNSFKLHYLHYLNVIT